MTAPSNCPAPERLATLLKGDPATAEDEALALHLDQCDACQRAMERAALEGREDSILAMAPELVGPEGNDREPSDAAILRDLKARLGDAAVPAPSPTEDGPGEADLAFLGPATRPGVLGTFARYEVVDVVGRGGMGTVLKAFEPALNRFVAIKVLLAPHLPAAVASRKRFAREARAAAAISHEHVLSIHAIDEHRGIPYLVMPFIMGGSLQDRLDESGPLELAQILRIGMQAAAGLAAAHAQGVIHRDVKPSNILLEKGVERVWITDFGLACSLDDGSLTESGIVAGTPQYMAPEQARGEPLDPRADLFGLGCVLYAMCVGRAPFRGPNALAVLKRVCEDHPRPIAELNPEIPAWLTAIIGKLLAKHPDARYQNASEVAELLEARLARIQAPVASRHAFDEFTPSPLTEVPSSRRWARRWRMAGLGLITAMAGLGWSEAMEVTHLSDAVATIFLVRTSQGTLVVQVDDPDVTVTVDDEAREVTLRGGGIHELKLRPGRHALRASKDGRPIHEEILTITRGGRRIARIGQQAVEEAPSRAIGGDPSPPPRDIEEKGEVGERRFRENRLAEQNKRPREFQGGTPGQPSPSHTAANLFPPRRQPDWNDFGTLPQAVSPGGSDDRFEDYGTLP
jgi:hypothetical protein